MQPDGVSYLDLSDALIQRRGGDFVNQYWSPLYPALIAAMRVVLRPSAYWEFAAVHLLNFALLAACLAAFERFRRSLPNNGVPLRRATWLSYTLFACACLFMMNLELVTPDLLATTFVLIAMGAMARVRADLKSGRDAIVAGLSLGLAALAKAFFAPWSVVALAMFAVALGRSRWRAATLSATCFIVVIAPWAIVVSRDAGHLTFGQAGRLTYLWYVDGAAPPTVGALPPNARTASIDSILPGAGVIPDGRGTDPLWFDPARWSSGAPRFNAARQLRATWIWARYALRILAPLMAIVCVVAAFAGADASRRLWTEHWPILVPALVGMAAYALVLVTMRYLAPFALLISVVAVTRLPWPDRVSHRAAVLAVAAASLVILASADTLLLGATCGALWCAMVAHVGRRLGMLALAGGVVIGASLISVLPAVAWPIGLALVVITAAAFWVLSSDASRPSDGLAFRHRAGTALIGFMLGAIVLRSGVPANLDDVRSLGREMVSRNRSSDIAHDLANRGLASGSRIALVGSADRATWARSGRLRIVADVPDFVASRFWSLDAMSQSRLLALFAASGATYAVAVARPAITPPGWSATPSGAWVRPLP